METLTAIALNDFIDREAKFREAANELLANDRVQIDRRNGQYWRGRGLDPLLGLGK